MGHQRSSPRRPRAPVAWLVWRVDQLICRANTAPSQLAAHGKQLVRRRLEPRSFDPEATRRISRTTGSASCRPFRGPRLLCNLATPLCPHSCSQPPPSHRMLPGRRRQLPAARFSVTPRPKTHPRCAQSTLRTSGARRPRALAMQPDESSMPTAVASHYPAIGCSRGVGGSSRRRDSCFQRGPWGHSMRTPTAKGAHGPKTHFRARTILTKILLVTCERGPLGWLLSPTPI